MSVLSTNHRDHSLSYEHELLSISSKKIFDWTERIDNIYITPVIYSFQVLHYKQNQTTYLYEQVYWLNVQYVVWGLYEWFVWD